MTRDKYDDDVVDDDVDDANEKKEDGAQDKINQPQPVGWGTNSCNMFRLVISHLSTKY